MQQQQSQQQQQQLQQPLQNQRPDQQLQQQQQQTQIQQVSDRQITQQQSNQQNQQAYHQNQTNKQQQNEKIIESIKERLESLFIRDSLLNDKFLLSQITNDYQLPITRILEESSIANIFQQYNQKSEFYKQFLLDQALQRLHNQVEIITHAQMSNNFRLINVKLKYQKLRTQIEVRFDPPQREEAKRLVEQEVKKSETAGKIIKVEIQDRHYKDKFFVFTETNQDAIDLFMMIFKLKFENGKSVFAQIQDTDFIAKAIWQHFQQHIEARNHYVRSNIQESITKQYQIFMSQQNRNNLVYNPNQHQRSSNSSRGNNQYNGGLTFNNNSQNRQGQYQQNSSNNRQNNAHFNSYRQNNQNRATDNYQKPFNPDENSFPNLEASTQQIEATQNQYFEQSQYQGQAGQSYANQQQQQVQRQPQQQVSGSNQ